VVKDRQAQYGDLQPTLFAGDNIGASQLANGLFHEEPVTAAGNDKAKFKIGFIGEVLEGTPTIVTPTGVAGLTFQDEADAANRVVKQLQKKGVSTAVLVIHQGGFQNPSSAAALNGCAGNLAGSDIAEIAARLDPAIKVIVSAHTHAEYRCTISIGGVTRLITSASSFGRILSDITLTLDDATGELVQASAENIIVDNAKNLRESSSTVRDPDPAKADPAVQGVVDQYINASAPLANQVIGRIQGDLTRTASPRGESTLGDVIADAQYLATHPAGLGESAFAFMNPGGIRGDLCQRDLVRGRGSRRGDVRRGVHRAAVRQQPRHEDDDGRHDPPRPTAAVPRRNDAVQRGHRAGGGPGSADLVDVQVRVGPGRGDV